MSDTADPKKSLLAALGRVPSGLFILTYRRGQDETGMLVSWVQQCSFDPPLVTVALGAGRDAIQWMTPDAPFTLNVLDDTQSDMLSHFGRGFGPSQPAFEGIEVDRPGGAAPVLTDALAYLDCRVVERLRTGDHELVVGRVVASRVLEEGRPMVHVRKSGSHY